LRYPSSVQWSGYDIEKSPKHSSTYTPVRFCLNLPRTSSLSFDTSVEVTMERSASRRKADRLLYELEDCLSLMERKHGLCDASVMESSNLGFSTRDDCSFEYSEIGDLSLDNSQSLMDETNGPLLVALVEEYILGQRLQMMATRESDEDEESPTSSFESETCFSHENSELLQQISGNDSFFSNNSDQGSQYDEIEIPETTTHQHSRSGKAKLSDKSRWQALLLSLSNTRYSLTKNSNRDSSNSNSRVFLGVATLDSNAGLVPATENHTSLSKRDSNGESTPSVIHKSWDRLKAVNPLKRSVLHNGANSNSIATARTVINVKSLFSPSESSKAPHDQESMINSLISTDVLKSSSVLNTAPCQKEILSDSTIGKKESFPMAALEEPIPVDEADVLKIEQAEPTEEIIHIFDENFKNCAADRENVENKNWEVYQSRKSKSDGEDVKFVDLGDTKEDNEVLLESVHIDKTPIVSSDYNESIEVPNHPSVEGEQNQQRTVVSPMRGKMRLSLPKRFSGHYSQICQTHTDVPVGSEIQERKRIKNGKLIRKPMLCSHCRCKLSEQSICAAMASESLDSEVCDDKVEVEPDLLQTCDRIMEEDIVASNERLTAENHVECIEKQRSMESALLQSNGTVSQFDLVEDPPATSDNLVKDRPETCDALCSPATVCTNQEINEAQSHADCPGNKVEAVIFSPQRRTETPTIHIEFKDWQGNEVEIVQESSHKKANRLFWKQGLFPIKDSSKTCSPHFTPQNEATGKNSGDIPSVEHNTADETRVESEANIEYNVDSNDHVDFAVACSATEVPKKVSKKKYLGMITKRTRQRIPKTSGCMKVDATINHRLVEEPFHDKPNPISLTTNVEEQMLDDKKDIPATENVDDSNEATPCAPDVPNDAAIIENEEALLLEQAMKEIHTDSRYDAEGSKTRSFLRSPVTLYRFLDYNPCRNELVHENSYDVFADPVGLSVAELFAPKACFAKRDDDKELQVSEKNENGESGQVSEIGVTQSLKPPSSNSSLKKVFRRLSKKVAFRDNLIETSPRDTRSTKVVRAASTMKKHKSAVDSKLERVTLTQTPGHLSTIQPDTNQMDVQRKNTTDEKKIPEDILKKLLKETSKAKKTRALAKVDLSPDNRETGENIDCTDTKKTKIIVRKTGTSSPKAVKKASRKKSRSPKTKGEKAAKSRVHAERVAQLLSELKKVKAASKSQGGTTSEYIDEESPTQRASDATIATLGTRQSHTSSLSRLTTEEQKLARRMINDIQLLAKIEKKRRSTGNKKSSLKSSDMDRTLKLLLAIEASRRNRIPASTKVGKEVSIPSQKTADETCSIQPKEINPMKNVVSVFGGLSFFTDTPSKEKNS
jgi:hypothetical protein